MNDDDVRPPEGEAQQAPQDAPAPGAAPAPEPREDAQEAALGFSPPFAFSPRRLAETAGMGARNLLRHKLRSFLTTLGIVFGVGAVVSMMSVTAGASQELLERIHRLGTQNILLNSVRPPEQQTAGSTQSGWVKEYGLKERDARVLEGAVPGIRNVVRALRAVRKVYLGGRQTEPQILGVEPAYFEALHLDVERGRSLTDLDEASLACVCVVGPTLYESLGGVGDPIGQVVRIGDTPFEIRGVLAPGSAGGKGDDIYVPFSTSARRFGLLQARMGSGSMEAYRMEVSTLVLRCQEPRHVLPAAVVTEHVMERLHEERDYEVTVPLRLLEQAESTQRVFQVVMVLIAGISLVVGGIGIANTMFAGVVERTREIGIRRALGARKSDILAQFLTETILIAVAGGFFGCLVGVGGMLAIARFTGWPVSVAAGPFVLSILISGLVGVVSGIAPARRAARLDPVAALRHE